MKSCWEVDSDMSMTTRRHRNDSDLEETIAITVQVLVIQEKLALENLKQKRWLTNEEGWLIGFYAVHFC